VRQRLAANVVIVASAVVALVWLAVSPAGLFSGDEGIKLAETQSLAFHSYREASLYEPGARFTTNGEFRPFGGAPFVFTGDDPTRVYGTYPLLYPALAAPLYRLGGYRGMALLSFAGFVAVLILTARLARRCSLSEPAVACAVAIVGFGTTLPLYSATIYEHTVAAAMVLAAIDVTLGGPAAAGRMWIGGVLFGLATCFRTELYAFAPAMTIVVAWRLGIGRTSWRRWLAFAAGSMCVVAGFVVVHRLATPVWHPTLAASADGEVPALGRRLGHVIAYELVDSGWMLVVATLVVFAARRWLRLPPIIATLMSGAWGIAAMLAIRDVGDPDVRAVTGMLTASPVLALGVMRSSGLRRQGSEVSVLALAAICYCATVVLLPKGAALGGLELGARYLLPVTPLLAIAATAVARRHPIDRTCWAVLFGISAAATAVNAKQQWRIRELGAEVLAAVDSAGAPVMFTEVWWVAQLAIPAQADDVSLFVADRPTAIYDRLYDAGIRRIVAIRGSPPRPTGHIQVRMLSEASINDRRLNPHVYELYEIPAVRTRGWRALR
jgi:hypothetical protein